MILAEDIFCNPLPIMVCMVQVSCDVENRKMKCSLRRSVSDEHLYAVPAGLKGRSNSKPTVKVKSLPKGDYAVPYEVINLKKPEAQELHYMVCNTLH